MKKKLVIFIGLIAVIYFVLLQGYNSFHTRTSASLQTPDSVSANQPIPEPTTSESTTLENPLAIQIPAINVETRIEHVGLADDGRMAVPESYETVGWFDRGSKPGDLGSAVIAGHLDSPSGEAVFYNLEKLVLGDEIIVKDDKGVSQTFVVEEMTTYEDTNFPIDLVFKRADKKRLNLITCQGSFDRSSQNYSHRLVVFAVLIE